MAAAKPDKAIFILSQAMVEGRHQLFITPELVKTGSGQLGEKDGIHQYHQQDGQVFPHIGKQIIKGVHQNFRYSILS